MNIKTIFLLLFLTSFSVFSQIDTVKFSDENSGLINTAANEDSISKSYKGSVYPNPFSPTTKSYSAKISIYETTKLTIKVKDVKERDMVTFIWKKVTPGYYSFDWWEYTGEIPSGIYYIEKIIDNKSETKKAIYVK